MRGQSTEGGLDLTDASFALPATPPFHLEATVRLLQRRPTNRVDLWESGHYLRVLPTHDGLRLVAVSNVGTVDAPEPRGEVFGGPVATAEAEQLAATVRLILGTDVDATPFYRVAARDPRLHAVATALRGLKPPRFPTLFETIANVIPFQQVSLAAGAALVARLVERCGERLSLGGRTYHAFPQPERVAQLGTGELQSLGLSRAKAVALHELAARVLSGELTTERLEALPTEAAMEVLTALPGIGPWSAGLILLRGLQRMEVFPDGDVGAAKNLARLLNLEGPVSVRDLRPLCDGFGSVKGYLYFYALGWRLLDEGLITAARSH
jgi:3-methyladenine DNA glycosylase/8-oxoguanine DNA glycosylase